MDSCGVFVCSDDHQLLSIRLIPNNSINTVSVEGKWFEFVSDSRVLHQISAQTLLLPCNVATASIICSEVIADAVTGEKVPYIVVAAQSGDGKDPYSSITLFILGGGRGKLCIAAQTLFVPSSFCSLDDGTDILALLQSSVKVFDGPTVLFFCENTGRFHVIYRICSVGSSHLITSELDHYTGRINYEELPCSSRDADNRQYNCHQFIYADVKFSHWHRTTVLTLHSVSTMKSLENKNMPFSLIKTTIKITDGGQNIQQDTTLSDLIPDVYASICTSVLSIPKSRCHLFLHEEVQNDVESTAARDIVICTKFGHMAQFCHQHLFTCKEIPASDIKQMFLVDAFDNEYVVAISKGKGVMAAKLENLQLCGHWSAARYAIAGDFLQNGTEQLLLLPHSASDLEESTTISSFCLTDFGYHCIDTLDDTKAKSEPMEDGESSNIGMMVEQLESRVQCGMSALTEADDLCEKKMAIARKTASNLLHMSTGIITDSRRRHESAMVDFFSDGGNHITSSASYAQNQDDPTPSFDVVETWQRIFANKWVVGVDVINRTQRDISEIKLSLVQVSDHLPKLSCHSKVLRNIQSKNLKRAAEPDTKRRKVVPVNGQPYSITSPDEEDIITLTTVTDLPKFTVPMISCHLLLQWSFAVANGPGSLHGSFPENGAGDACQPYNVHQCQWICGDITLKVEDVIAGKFNINLKMPSEVCESRRLVQCLNTSQSETHLLLQSSFLSHNDLRSTLQRFGLSYHNSYHSYVDLEPGVFHSLRVDLKPKGQDQGLWITVHSNDDNQLMMFIHRLYSDLPDDLNIICSKRGNLSYAMGTALNSMVQEVSQLSHGITQALKSTDQTDEMDADQESSDQNVADIRLNFEQKKRKLMEDDVMLSVASQAVVSPDHLQSQTDKAISRMIKTSERL